MFIINSKLGSLTLTFVTYVTLFLVLSACSDAKDVHLQYRGHANLKRLIKKRSTVPLVPVIGAGAAAPTPPSPTDTTAVTSTTSSITTSTTSTTATTDTSSSVSR